MLSIGDAVNIDCCAESFSEWGFTHSAYRLDQNSKARRNQQSAKIFTVSFLQASGCFVL